MSEQKHTGQTHTIVVEFPEGVSPRYHADMEALGGRVVAVAFDGNRLDVEMALLDALQGLMDNSTRSDWPDDIYDAAEAAIALATSQDNSPHHNKEGGV